MGLGLGLEIVDWIGDFYWDFGLGIWILLGIGSGNWIKEFPENPKGFIEKYAVNFAKLNHIRNHPSGTCKGC